MLGTKEHHKLVKAVLENSEGKNSVEFKHNKCACPVKPNLRSYMLVPTQQPFGLIMLVKEFKIVRDELDEYSKMRKNLILVC